MRSLISIAAAGLVYLVSFTGIADAAQTHTTAPGGKTVVCGPDGCIDIVTDPPTKTQKNSPKRSSNEQTTGKPVCKTKAGATVPCYSKTLGNFNNSDGCYYMLDQAKTDNIIMRPPGKTKGGFYDITCFNGDQPIMRTDWLDAPRTVIRPPTVTPAELAKKAFAELTFPHPTTGRGPGGTLRDGRPYSLVRAYTWFWTNPDTYKALSKRAQAGPVWAQVTVTPTALTFRPGDGGSVVSCSGPGTPWVQGKNSPWSASPSGCDYSYPHSTYSDANGELTGTYGIVWKATWVGSGGSGGTFPDITTTTQSTFAVAEAEAVVVN